jgi:hypothetical protein
MGAGKLKMWNADRGLRIHRSQWRRRGRVFAHQWAGEGVEVDAAAPLSCSIQLAFTACIFRDCNIDKLEPDEARGFYVIDNFFDRRLERRRTDFETRLAQALAGRKAKEKWRLPLHS